MLEKLLTVKQVSELLEVDPSTIYNWVEEERIPFVRFGRSIRFQKKDLFRWIDLHTHREKRESRALKKPASKLREIQQNLLFDTTGS